MISWEVIQIIGGLYGKKKSREKDWSPRKLSCKFLYTEVPFKKITVCRKFTVAVSNLFTSLLLFFLKELFKSILPIEQKEVIFFILPFSLIRSWIFYPKDYFLKNNENIWFLIKIHLWLNLLEVKLLGSTFEVCRHIYTLTGKNAQGILEKFI